MSDERLYNLTVQEPPAKYKTALKIDRIKFTNYKFFNGEFELPINGENLLLYGENGSGKSTVYKALQLLTKTSFTDFDKNLNIFADDGEIPEVEFGFTNSQELTVTSDLEEIPEHVDFLKGLSIFEPMLDYKKLLSIHYSPDMDNEKINLYLMLKKLLKDYPLGKGGNKKTLSEIKDFQEYFNSLEKILNGELLLDVNTFLNKYFETHVKIEKFVLHQEFVDELDVVEQIVNLELDYKEHSVEKYHTFLNEARLSALAMSIYFVVIKKLLNKINHTGLKILVLDGLLISLDMSNRLKLLEILKNEFSEFQIFFFTHDKELFEIYKNKMNWKKYELYLDDSGDIPKVICKSGNSELERAKKYFALKEYDCCALLLRKGFEKTLKTYLTPKEQRDRNCEDLDLSKLVGKAISKSSGENKVILEKLNSDRTHILNPLSHNDSRAIYSEELKMAMSNLEKLKEMLK